jgi:hypothetical protein
MDTIWDEYEEWLREQDTPEAVRASEDWAREKREQEAAAWAAIEARS